MIKMDKGPDKPPRYTESDWNTESSLDNSEPLLHSVSLLFELLSTEKQGTPCSD